MFKELAAIMIRRLFFRSSSFTERVLSYVHNKKYNDSITVNVNLDKESYLNEVNKFKFALLNFLSTRELDSVEQKKISIFFELYISSFSTNNSLINHECHNFYELLLIIIKNLKRKKYNAIEHQLLLIMQLYGLSRGNPLVRMENFKSNGAWKNGSIDGYPFIIILDILRTYRLTYKSRLANIYLQSCDYKILLADCAYNYLLDNEVDKSIMLFEFLLKRIFNDINIESLWLESYKIISDLFCENRQKKVTGNGITVKSEKHYPGIKKICISGMGWSGSGALFDFFKEFKNIETVEGEFQHLSGVTSLKTLRETAGDDNLFRKEMLKYFGLTLFGFSKYRSYQEYRTLLITNRLTLSENRYIYAKGVKDLCQLLVNSYLDNELGSEIFQASSNIILNSISGFDQPESSDSIYMFDNIIKLYRISEIDYIDDAIVLCTYRDPRSNFVALYNENLKFKQDVKSFVKNYKSKREKAKKELLKTRKKDCVINVQFEEFVSSEEYRNRLAERIGFRLSEQNKYSCFQPWVSEKNIYNYKDFHDQHAIAFIEKELADYLWSE